MAGETFWYKSGRRKTTYDATVVIQAKKEENLTSMLGVDVQERKCIDD